jgi:hypothetical protein
MKHPDIVDLIITLAYTACNFPNQFKPSPIGFLNFKEEFDRSENGETRDFNSSDD